MTTTLETSPAGKLALRLVRSLGKERAHRVLDVVLAKFTTSELAAMAAHWELWARPKQLPPPGDVWRTWGFLAGRGFGKTFAVSKFVNDEVMAGRAMHVGLAAQDEENCIQLQVLGPSGLIATAPPWFKPRWEATAKQLVWPNGARAYVRTPEVPGKIRGFEYDLAWLCELQSWPVATREEAFSNFRISTRLALARIVWDATPKKRNPILLELLADASAEPEKHIIVRGSTRENAQNLGDGYVDDLEKKYGGTAKGREELDGEMLDDSEGALVRQAWIDAARRSMPSGAGAIVRRAIGVDPAVTTNAGSDMTGIIEAGLSVDGQALVLADRTGKHSPPEWAGIVLDLYVNDACDLVIVETNKGGQLLTHNLRMAAQARGLRVEVIDRDKWSPHRQRGVVFVLEVYGRGSKVDRAQPLATAYEKGRVSHVTGVDLTELETTLTTWEPAPNTRSPDRLDPLVYVVGELLGIDVNVADRRDGYRGIVQMGRALGGRPLSPSAGRSLTSLLGGGVGAGKI